MLPLSLGPAKTISEYDGGCNFLYIGTLSRTFRARWPLETMTHAACVATSVARLDELCPGPSRTACLVRGSVYAVEKRKWEQVEWIVPRLPTEFALYSDKLTRAIMKTGVVPAINFAISISETKAARPIFRIGAVDAVRSGHSDAAKYLCTRFFVDKRGIKGVALAASSVGNLPLVEWCLDNMTSFPTEATRALVYTGNIEALKPLKSAKSGICALRSEKLVLYAALGVCLEAIDWFLDQTTPRFNAREICLMVSTKGLLHVLEHLVERRGFAYNRAECVRFAKKGSGVADWLLIRG